mmetsp:Transcript_18758/g.52217  ORF Transcript_18758/g.52217 Transcript_18758/m.52217 type:complete len:281 (-) Transcript_18758:71-913(-)
MLDCQLIEEGSNSTARPAPRGREVHHHQLLRPRCREDGIELRLPSLHLDDALRARIRASGNSLAGSACRRLDRSCEGLGHPLGLCLQLGFLLLSFGLLLTLGLGISLRSQLHLCLSLGCCRCCISCSSGLGLSFLLRLGLSLHLCPGCLLLAGSGLRLDGRLPLRLLLIGLQTSSLSFCQWCHLPLQILCVRLELGCAIAEVQDLCHHCLPVDLSVWVGFLGLPNHLLHPCAQPLYLIIHFIQLGLPLQRRVPFPHLFQLVLRHLLLQGGELLLRFLVCC